MPSWFPQSSVIDKASFTPWNFIRLVLHLRLHPFSFSLNSIHLCCAPWNSISCIPSTSSILRQALNELALVAACDKVPSRAVYGIRVTCAENFSFICLRERVRAGVLSPGLLFSFSLGGVLQNI